MEIREWRLERGDWRVEIGECRVQSAEQTALIAFGVCVTLKAIYIEFTSCRNTNEK